MKNPLDKAKGYEVVWHQVKPVFDMAHLVLDMSYVYIIGEEDNGPVKIGWAKDPIARLRSLQTGNPRRLRVEFVLGGDGTGEKMLHRGWEQYAIFSASARGKPDRAPGTEWFRKEIRKDLFPVIQTAADEQIALLKTVQLRRGEVVTTEQLDACIKFAHKKHRIVRKGHDTVTLLGAQVGSVTRTTRAATL